MTNSSKWALVTGASSGIGQAIAKALSQAGWDIFVNHFNDLDGALRTSEMIQANGRSAVPIAADVGAGDQVRSMFETIRATSGTLDVLVNNAGVQTWAGFLELKESDWDRTIATNLKGTFLCTQNAGLIMKESGKGSIVNIGSGANHIPFPKLVDYCASKGGIEMLTKCAATELGPLGIRVNCVAPGAIENERTRIENPEYAKTWSAITPIRRCGTLDDVAQAVTFLCSSNASFINGQTLFVDGGLWTRNQWPYSDS